MSPFWEAATRVCHAQRVSITGPSQIGSKARRLTDGFIPTRFIQVSKVKASKRKRGSELRGKEESEAIRREARRVAKHFGWEPEAQGEGFLSGFKK